MGHCRTYLKSNKTIEELRTVKNLEISQNSSLVQIDDKLPMIVYRQTKAQFNALILIAYLLSSNAKVNTFTSARQLSYTPCSLFL